MVRQTLCRTAVVSHGDDCNGTSQCGREIRLNSKYSLGKWKFITKEQCEVQWMENYYEETSRVREAPAKPT